MAPKGEGLEESFAHIEEQLDADREHMAELKQSIQNIHEANRESDRMTKENFMKWLDSSHKLKEQAETRRRLTMQEFTKFPDYPHKHEDAISEIMRNNANGTFAPS